MRRFHVVLVSAFLIGGCAATSTIKEGKRQSGISPITDLSTSPYRTLKAEIDATLPDTLFPPANVGIKVVSLSDNETLYELNPDMLFVPASNNKLFTSAAALVELGKDFKFTTGLNVVRDSSRLYIKGSGDPLLSTEDVDSIARAIKGKIPTDSQWTLVGDVSYFDDLYWGAGWTWDEGPEPYGMYLSPLSLNANSVEVRVRPGKTVGDSVTVTVVPATSYTPIINNGWTVRDSALFPLDISRDWRKNSNAITVTGEQTLRDTLSTRRLNVWQPERYLLTLLAERLQSRGLKVKEIQIDTVPASAEPLMHFSHRLDSAVTLLNKVSDNMTAENMLKTLSAERNGPPGSATAGTSLVMRYLASLGIDTTRTSMADGSGLSRYNLTSPNIIIRLLTDMYNRKEMFETFYNSLPIASVDGTIANRMKSTPAQGNLRAKTGTLSGVTSLSGYVRTADGELLAFSILMNNFASGSRPYRQVQDKIGVILSGMMRKGL